MKGYSYLFIMLLAGSIFSSCGSYRQNIMFKVPQQGEIQKQAEATERNYVIQVNDYLKLAVYTNEGERIIDPDLELIKGMSVQGMNLRPNPDYLVDVHGVVKFPQVGELNVKGLTIRQAEAILQKEYENFYTDPFVVLQYTNKRVVVLGNSGGLVVPLTNENVTLAEILALSKSIDNNAKANNIRVLRNNDFFVADLTTLEGYQKSNMIMQHGDIVYVEPIRRPLSEAVRDYGPILSLGLSVTTLLVVILGTK